MKFVRLGHGDARGAPRFDAFEHPCHVAAQVAHGCHALGILESFFGRASKGDVPVGGGDDGHLIDGEVLVEHVDAGARSCAASDGDGCSGLVGKGSAAGVESAIEEGEDAPRRMRVIDRCAKDKAVGLGGEV